MKSSTNVGSSVSDPPMNEFEIASVSLDRGNYNVLYGTRYPHDPTKEMRIFALKEKETGKTYYGDEMTPILKGELMRDTWNQIKDHARSYFNK